MAGEDNIRVSDQSSEVPSGTDDTNNHDRDDGVNLDGHVLVERLGNKGASGLGFGLD